MDEYSDEQSIQLYILKLRKERTSLLWKLCNNICFFFKKNDGKIAELTRKRRKLKEKFAFLLWKEGTRGKAQLHTFFFSFKKNQVMYNSGETNSEEDS